MHVCMNSIMYFLLTSYILIMFLKVLSHFIMKIKNFMKYFKEGVMKYFKIFMKFLNISSCMVGRASHQFWITYDYPLLRYDDLNLTALSISVEVNARTVSHVLLVHTECETFIYLESQTVNCLFTTQLLWDSDNNN